MLRTREDANPAAPDVGEAAQVDVAVIGAGLSGLVCALRLQQAGLDSVAVFEAKDRVGGRTLNQPIAGRHGAGRHIVEGGGQWVGPGQDRVLALADELGVETYPSWDQGQDVMVLQGRRRTYHACMPFPFVRPALDFMQAALRLQFAAWGVDRDRPWTAGAARRLDSTTLQDWLNQHVRTDSARTMFDIASGLALGGDPRDLSLLGVLQHIRSAGGLHKLLSIRGGAQERRLAGGAQSLSLKLAARLGTRVYLDSPVDSLRWTPHGALVHAGGRVWSARCVVVAMSPVDRACIRFEPGLPPAQAQLGRRMQMFKGIKVHAVYARPFWRDLGLSGQALGDEGPAPATFDNSPPGGTVGVLTAFVAGKTSYKAVAPTQAQLDDPALRREGVLDCLVRYFGEEARTPIDYIEQDWRSESHIAGCIPTMPPGVLTELGPQLTETTGPIVWAGTESSHVWNGYMDGAVRSGERAAELAAGICRAAATSSQPL